jgi:thymidylate kinase
MKEKSNFFNLMFDNFNKFNLKYSLMNGYEGYPESIGSDIDICVENMNEFEKLIENLSVILGFKLVQKLEHHVGCINFFIVMYGDKHHSLLSLDAYSGYVYKNKVLFNSDWFISDFNKVKNFHVPKIENEFVYYFIKKIIKQDLNKNLSFFFKRFSVIENKVDFSNFFPNSDNVIMEAFKAKDISYFLESEVSLKNELDLRIGRGFNPIQVVKEALRILRRIKKPRGLMVAMLGPDGCGKSVIIDTVKELDLPFRRVDYFHLKPRIIGSKGDGKPIKDPHSKPDYKGFLSYLKLLHFMVDYWIGFLIKVLPLKIKSSLVIFDRYYDDIYIDPKRFRYGGSKSFAKLMKFFIPKPDITFVLTTLPEVIIARKQEVSLKELTRQIGDYRKIRGESIVHMDVNDNIDSISLQVQKSIYVKLNERY